MNFKAFKMDGLGNDFIIIDQRVNHINLSNDKITKICDRSFIGCDQLIIIKNCDSSDAELVFYNSDGSISGACGNGTRCLAYFISEEINKKEISLKTKSGILLSRILEKNFVETSIGYPKIDWKDIPLKKNMNTLNLGIKIEDYKRKIFTGGTAINVGNPHLIFFVEDINNYDLKKIGSNLENDPLFPDRCNVTLAKVENSRNISIRVWERGAGLTKACGSAACATAFAGKINNLTNDNVEIIFELGNLNINIEKNNLIKMKGPVSDIKEINIKL